MGHDLHPDPELGQARRLRVSGAGTTGRLALGADEVGEPPRGAAKAAAAIERPVTGSGWAAAFTALEPILPTRLKVPLASEDRHAAR